MFSISCSSQSRSRPLEVRYGVLRLLRHARIVRLRKRRKLLDCAVELFRESLALPGLLFPEWTHVLGLPCVLYQFDQPLELRNLCKFRGGVTVYTNDVKLLLGVKPETLERHSAVSRETAVELADCVRLKLGADYGLSVTGVAGPDSDGIHPVGTVFVGLSTPEETFVRALQLGEKSDRSRIRTLAANHAFDMLRRRLTGLPVAL